MQADGDPGAGVEQAGEARGTAAGRIERAALGVVVLLGAAVRATLWGRFPTRNELQDIDLEGWGLVAALTGPETSVNPPLWRDLFTALGDGAGSDALGLTVARGVALACSLGAVAWGWRVVRRAGGAAPAALAAAAWLALHPAVVEESVKHRAYGAWLLAALVFAGLWGDHLARTPSDRGSSGWGAAGAACVAAWLHYLTVPILAVAAIAGWVWTGDGDRGGRARWRRAAPPLVGLASLAPLAPAVLRGSTSNVAPPSDPLQRLEGLSTVLGWGLRAPAGLGLPPGLRSLPVAVGLGIGLAAVAVWAARRARGRTVALASLGAGAALSVAVLGQVQVVRSAAVVMTLGLGAPTLAAAARGVRGSAGVGILTAAGLLHLTAHDLPRRAVHQLQREAVPQAVTWLEQQGAGDVVVAPVSWVDAVEYAWHGRRLRRDERPSCGRGVRCFDHGGGRVRGAGRGVSLPPAPWALTFDGRPPPDPACGLVAADPRRRARLWRCPEPTAEGDDTARGGEAP